MASAQPAIGVCGFGRCGSTMVMQMLVAGGLPPVDGAELPPHELQDLRSAWSVPLAGRAAKLLDSANYYGVPPGPEWRFVWLDRDSLEQARSHVKFAQALLGLDLGDDAVGRFAESYPRDRPKVLGILRRRGTVLVLDYERVLANPRREARRLRQVWPGLDVDAAAAVVHDRDGRCRPDLAVELALTEGAGRG